MKRNVPQSAVVPGHRDYEVLSSIAAEILSRAGNRELKTEIPGMLRECVDHLINTPRTSRRSFQELEKVEKTFIGTHVEIAVLKYLRLPRGTVLDTRLAGHNVDIKFTTRSDWMIPPEAIDQPCILVAADETRHLCYFGICVAWRSALRIGDNRDDKGSLKASSFKDIYWLLREEPYPSNFWQTVPPTSVARIFEARTGDDRIVQLFTEVQRRPIGRSVILDAGGSQLDPMRRSRGDARGGTRERLRDAGTLLMSGTKHRDLIAQLELPACGRSDFISLYLGKDDLLWNMVAKWEAALKNAKNG